MSGLLSRRRVLASAAALPVAGRLQAQSVGPYRKFAVLSLVGDKLFVITARAQTGTSVDRNVRQEVDQPDPHFDRLALKMVEAELQRLSIDASPDLLLGTEQAYQAAPLLIDGDRFNPTNDLRAALSEGKASHLILLTKHRADAAIRLGSLSTGQGKIEGLGFYVDLGVKVQRSDTGEVAQGFLGVYAYAKAHLIDVQSGKVLSSAVITESESHSAARSGDRVNPWNVLSESEKVARLSILLHNGIAQSMPRLLAAKE